MEQAGVQLIVEGLGQFKSDLSEANGAIKDFAGGGTILGSVFGALGNTIDNFVSFSLRTLEHALGELIADAVEWAIQKFKELVQATIDAGNEFQTLELRLKGLNFNALLESGTDYNEATTESIRLTREQLDWLQRLAATTPYDNTDISNVYTLSRSYGYTDQEARDLTNTVSNFAAGMGLSSEHIERIIINLGQMRAQGKVTGTELRDLGRGSFVPVNDVLLRIQKNLGLTTEELIDLRKKGLLPAEEFTKAFSQIVEERFSGAAERMAKTFGAAKDNLMDIVKSIGGLNIVKPILDVIGAKLAGFISVFTEDTRWDNLVYTAQRVGDSIANIVSRILDLAPDAGTLADKIIVGLIKIQIWLDEHSDDIVEWVKKAAKWVQDTLVPALQEVWKWLFGTGGEPTTGPLGELRDLWEWLGEEPPDNRGFIQKFIDWIKTDFIPIMEETLVWFNTSMVPVLNELPGLFGALVPLAEALFHVLLALFGTEEGKSFADFIREDLVPAIQSLTDWIDKNRDTIASLIKIYLALEIIYIVVSWFIHFGVKLMAFIAIVQWTTSSIGAFAAVLASSIMKLAEYVNLVKSFVTSWYEKIKWVVDQIVSLFKNFDWAKLGFYILWGIAKGIASNSGLIISAATSAAKAAYEAAKRFLGINSPSKLFMEIGAGTMEGMSIGIVRSAKKATDVMRKTVGQVVSPAMSAPGAMYAAASPSVQTSYTNTNYFNQTIHTSANSEPIAQDFQMMQSLVGA